MVLTSREFVLAQARQFDERIANSGFLDVKYQLKLANYTKLIRAKILFNHLYFSNLDGDYIDELIKSHAPQFIIKHPNYSPRLIEWMTTNAALRGVDKAAFPKFFVQILNNPEKLWKHPFNKQISQAARNLLLVLFSLGMGVNTLRLQACFSAYHLFYCEKFGVQSSPQDFNNAMEELLGSFLRAEKSDIYFHNPSVKDFIEALIKKTPEFCLYIFSTAQYLEQTWRLWAVLKNDAGIAQAVTTSPFKDSLICSLIKLKDTAPFVEEKSADSTLWRGNDLALTARCFFLIDAYCVYREPTLLATAKDIVKKARETSQEKIVGTVTDWCELLTNLRPVVAKAPEIMEICDEIISLIEQKPKEINWLDGFTSVSAAMCFWNFSDGFQKEFKDRFKLYVEQEAFEEYRQLQSSSEIEAYLSEFEALTRNMEIDVEGEMEDIHQHLSESKEYEEARADHDYDAYKEQTAWSRDEDRQIDAMFNDLKDR